MLFAGPHTFSLPWQYRLAGAGKALGGASTRMRNVDSTGCGEVASLVYTLKLYPVIVRLFAFLHIVVIHFFKIYSLNFIY